MATAGTSSGPQVTIPTASSEVERALAATAGLGRSEAVRAIKDLRRAEWERIRTWQEQGINELTGMDACIALCSATDAIVRALVRRAGMPDGDPRWERFGIFAVGGYGRAEQNPHSDLDLLYLWTGDRQEAGVLDFVQEFSTLLWDVGFQVGDALRGLRELERIIATDFVTATAVLEQRPLIATPTVATALRTALHRFVGQAGKHFVRYKIEEEGERRSKAGVSPLVMEPHLKSTPGCLRDIQFLRNVAFVALQTRNLHGLRELGGITFSDVQRLMAANDHLLLVRALLHFHHGRRQDVWEAADQVRLAPLLGYASGGRFLDVEQMMRSHFARVLHVHHTVALTIERLRALGHAGARRFLIARRKRLDERFDLIDGRVYLAERDFWRRPHLLHELLDLAGRCQQSRARISLELQRNIGDRLGLILADELNDPSLGRMFLKLLGRLGGVRPMLEDLHDAGILGILIPEFGHLTCRVSFDGYHRYTVDQHTLFALGHLDDVAAGRAPGLGPMPILLRQCRRTDLLALGLLLHDIGKVARSGHVERGALMVAGICKRLGLSDSETDQVHFLVAHHVALSDASRMRDIHDPGLLSSLAARMGTQERLDALFCLTWADANAVGPGVLTHWQEALLLELYQAVSARLSGRPPAEIPSRRQAMLDRLVAEGVAIAEARSFVDGLPEHYAYQVDPDEAPGHFVQISEARRDGFSFRCEPRGSIFQVIIAMHDRPALFADVAAAMTANALDIVSAYGWCTTDGWVVERYRVAPLLRDSLAESEARDRLNTDLRAVIEGRVSAESLLARRRFMAGTGAPAETPAEGIEIRVDNSSAQRATIIDVRLRNRLGLLSVLGRAFRDLGCNIEFALVDTLGDIARDVFYVTQQGGKLDEGQTATVVRGLRTRLESFQTPARPLTTGTGVISF